MLISDKCMFLLCYRTVTRESEEGNVTIYIT